MSGSLVEAFEKAKKGGAAKVKAAKPTPTETSVSELLKPAGVVPPALRRPPAPINFEALKMAAEAIRGYRTGIHDCMYDWLTWFRAYGAASSEEQELQADDYRAGLNWLEEQLGPGNRQSANREAAIIAYAEALVATCPERCASLFGILESEKRSEEKEEKKELLGLPTLVEVGMVLPVSDDSVGVAGVRFKVYGRSYAAKTEKLASAIMALADRIAKANRADFEVVAKAYEAEATISFGQAASKTPGRFLVNVPEGAYRDRDGAERKLFGGILLMESDGERMWILAAAGRFQRKMEEQRDAGVTIAVEEVDQEKMISDRRLEDGEWQEFCQRRILHGILRRAMEGMEKEAAEEKREAEKKAARDQRVAAFNAGCDVEAEALRQKANVSDEAMLLDSNDGAAFIVLDQRHPWIVADRKSNKENRYHRVFFLLGRSQDRLRILEYPERLRPLFGDLFAEWTEEGELKYPLGVQLGLVKKFLLVKRGERLEEERRLALKAFAEEGHAPASEPAPEAAS